MKKYILILALFIFSLTSQAQVNVGVVERVKSVTANYSAVITDDNIFADATSGAITVTLPSAALKKGKVIKVFKTDSTTNNVVVNGNTISSTGNVDFLSNGTTWIQRGVVVNKTSSVNGFGSITWTSLTGCFFEDSAGSGMGDTDCGNGTIYPSGSVTGTTYYLSLTKSNLKANTVYKIVYSGQLATEYSGSNTQCKFLITDGTTLLATATGLTNASYTIHYQQNLIGYISYPTVQASKEFRVAAIRQAGSGTCRTYCHTSNDRCTLAIEEVYPTP